MYRKKTRTASRLGVASTYVCTHWPSNPSRLRFNECPDRVDADYLGLHIVYVSYKHNVHNDCHPNYYHPINNYLTFHTHGHV